MKKTKMTKKKGTKPLPPIPKSRVKAEVVKAPIAQSRRISGLGEPKFRAIGAAGDVCVIHREYVSDLLASATAGAFGVLGIPINPGNLLLFPWLSKMAENFESYVFKGLKFLFETDAPSTTPGTVLMAVDYDAVDALPATKGDMMSYRGATRTVPWARQELHCGKEDLHKRKTYYIRGLSEDSGATVGQLLQNGDDPRLDDVGTLIVGSSNCTSSALLGELYVEYEVELMTPKAGSGSVGAWHLEATNGIGINGLSVFGTVTEFGDSPSAPSNNPRLYDGLPIRYLLSSGTTSAFQFLAPGKTYMVVVDLEGNTGVSAAPAFGVAGSQLAINLQRGLILGTQGGTAWAVVTADQARSTTTDYGRLTVTCTGLTTAAGTNNDIWITELPNWSQFPFRNQLQPQCSRWTKRGKRHGIQSPPLNWFVSPSHPCLPQSCMNSSDDKLAESGRFDQPSDGDSSFRPESRQSTLTSRENINSSGGIGSPYGNKSLQMR
jgi:hypothetical protein